MTGRFLHHVTLDTGHSRRSYRDEASDAAVAHAADLIARARADGRVNLVGPLAHHGLTVAVEGHCLLATFDGPVGPHEQGVPHAGETMPLATAGVPRRSTAAPRLWAQLCAEIPADRLARVPRPPAPWCAVRLRPGIAGHMAAMAWMGDLERLIAWAWIEGRGDD